MASGSSPVTWGDRGPRPPENPGGGGMEGTPALAGGPGLRTAGTLPVEGGIHLLPLCSLPEEENA